MKKLFQTAQTQQDDTLHKQRTGLLCYIIGMVVILGIYRVMIAVVAQLRLFKTVDSYQKHVQGLSTFLLLLMLGLLWLAYRQWRDIIHERDQLETILASIGPDMILAIDRNDRILRCGGAVEQMSGYKPEELIGQKTNLLYHDRRIGGQGYEMQNSIRRSGFHIGYATGCHKDDGDYLLEIQTSRLRSWVGGAVLILRNLDERHQARVQLQRRIRMEELFASVSTEFLRADPNLFGNACQTALRQIAGVFGHESASAGFFDIQNGELRDIWIWQQDQQAIDPSFNQSLAEAAATADAADQTAYTFPDDLEQAPAPWQELHTRWNIRSIVLSPMQMLGRRFGFLALFSLEPRHRQWEQEDTTWLQAITSTLMSGELSIRSTKLLHQDSGHDGNAEAEPMQPNAETSTPEK